MKALLIGINAKYIHPNLAIRLLKANTKYDCDYIEFNIKDSKNKISDYINNSDYEIIGFSCYIWNIELIKEILKEIANKIVILGGPEVSYNAKYYLDNRLADYVIKNEGEEAFDMLLGYLHNNIKINEVPNLYYKNGYTYDKLVDLSKSKMAYDLLDDVKNQIVYIESSRGCPYKCAYCMASLDNKVRFFNTEEIKRQIGILIQRGAKTFKFLDRTFNADKKRFIDIIDYIIDNHKAYNSFQFEITGDLLDPDIIEYINQKAPKKLFRFEIGIQSTNIKANLAVGRIQNNEKLFNNIKLIQDADIIDLHLDLIAGLPYEDYESFKNTFNEVLDLRPKELQLGFLKLLYGTRLFNEKDNYKYIFTPCAPYEIIENEYLSKEDIKNIHITEEAFDKYYNSNYFKKTINLTLDAVNGYDFFYNLGLAYKEKKPKALEDTFRLLDDYLKSNSNYNELHKNLICEYLDYFKLKPKAWWDEKTSKEEKNEIIRYLVDNKLTEIDLDTLYKHSMVIKLSDSIILAVYTNAQAKIIVFNKCL